MTGYRKLSRKGDVRKSMLKQMTTTLIVNGHIKTTLARAQEVQKIAEKLITLAVKEANNYTTKEVKYSEAKRDAKNRKMLVSKTSKSGAEYDVVEREEKTKTVKVDNPSRLAARRRAMTRLVQMHDEYGEKINPVNHLFDIVAPAMANTNGGYTRIIRLGSRRGDGAEMVILSIGEYTPESSSEDDKE